MHTFYAFSSPSDKVDITLLVEDPRVLKTMEAVAREMAEKISKEIRDFEARFVDK
jgi:hypothetical protein